MGADVIKIEDTRGGDESRTWPPQRNGEAAAYIDNNRNKRGIALDLKAPEGAEIMRRLVRRADVLVENFRTGTMESFGLGYEALADIQPRLVYCSISAFGRTGPRAESAGYEAVMQAFSGVMSITGEPGGAPLRCGVSFVDLATGIFGAFGVVNALLRRHVTGRGQRVDASLLETSLSLLNYHAEAYLLSGVVAGPLGSSHPSIVPYRNFRCRDGRWVFIAGANDRLWQRLAAVIGLEHLVAEPRFATNPDRVQHRAELEAEVEMAIARHDEAALLALLAKADVPAVPVNTIDRVLGDPQSTAREMVERVPHPTLGEVRIVGVPVKFSEMRPRVWTHAPRLGEHTDEVLVEHGYSAAEIAELRARRVVA